MYIIVGLGNPDRKYQGTRHNIGFDVVDAFAKRFSIDVINKKFNALVGTGVAEGHKVVLVKPQTYMNLSGEAVGQAARFYKIPADHVLVISDDIALPAGKLRIRAGGSAGGHNGLKNIIQHLGTDRFPRIKVGVGSPQQAEHDIADWVTGKPMGEDQKVIIEALDKAVAAIPVLIEQGVDRAMNRFN